MVLSTEGNVCCHHGTYSLIGHSYMIVYYYNSLCIWGGRTTHSPRMEGCDGVTLLILRSFEEVREELSSTR